MIKNQRYVVLQSKELKNKPLGVLRMWEKMVFWRNKEGKAVCNIDSCCHRWVALSLGEISEDGCLACPFHGLRFDETGKCTLIPANGRWAKVPPSFRITTYKTYEHEWFIWIFWWDQEPTTTPEFFTNLDGLVYSSMTDHRATHYSRVIENQLDCAHLPFIHRKTIGRGNRTLVNGPVVQRTGPDWFHMYVYNALDQGQKPKTPKEITVDPENDFRLEFIFPNIWQNVISPKIRIVVAFVPIDNDNTLMYLRTYQWFVKVPVLRQLFEQISMYYNRKILAEDRSVVITHDPKISTIPSKELLFQADLPIIEYRKKRAELQKPLAK